MGHSQLPILAPLCLLCALLVLPAMKPGGLTPRSVSDPEVQKAVAFAVEELNRFSPNSYYYKALRVVDAKSKVDSGVKYYPRIVMAEANCERNDSNLKRYKEIQNCELSPQAWTKITICRFEIWFSPLLKKKMALTEMYCDDNLDSLGWI